MPATKHYDAATIARCETILRNAGRLSVSNEQPKTRARKAAKKVTDWRERPASNAQIKRIHAIEKQLGYRPSTIAAIGTAGEASDLYASLKVERAESL